MEVRKFIKDESGLEIKIGKVSEGVRKFAIRVKDEVLDKEYREEVYWFGVLTAFAYAALC